MNFEPFIIPKGNFDYGDKIGKLIAADLDSCCYYEFEEAWNIGAIEDSDLAFDYRIKSIDTGNDRLKWLQISLNGYPCHLLEKYTRSDDAAYHFKSYTLMPDDLFDCSDNAYKSHQKRFDFFLNLKSTSDGHLLTAYPDFSMVKRKEVAHPTIVSMRSRIGNFDLEKGFWSVSILRQCVAAFHTQRN